jgi:hypothetical protein
VPANAQSLTAGQSVQVYGELRNFHCQPTSEGFRTQTYSVAEICSLQGKVYARQPLGTAADLSATEPKSYCLTHDITLPSRLPPGDYVLNLQVYDLVGRQVTQTELPFSVR